MADNLNISLIMKLVNKVRGPAQDVKRDLQGIDQETTKLSERSRKAADRAAKAHRLIARGAVAGSAAVVTAGTASVVQAARMEDAWSEANKTLEMDPEALDRLKQKADEMTVSLALDDRYGIVDILAQGGQMGIRGEDELLTFAEDAAKMASTFDIVEAKAASIMGSWRETMSLSQDETRLLADQINFLGNTTSANSADLAEFSERALALATNFGLAREEALALGAGMIAGGAAPELAQTGLQATLRTLSKGSTDLSDTQGKMVQRLGLSSEDWDRLSAQLTTDAAGTMREVSQSISALPEEMRQSTMNQLFGDEAVKTMGRLLGDAEAMEQALSRIPDIAGASGSMEAEFLALSDDTLDNWKRLKNTLFAETDNFGEAVLPMVNEALKATLEIVPQVKGMLGPFMETISGLLSALGELANASTVRLRAIIEGFLDGFLPYIEPILEKLGPIRAQLSEIFSDIGEILMNVAKALGLAEANAGGNEVLASLAEALGHVLGVLGSAAATGISTVLDFIGGFYELIRALSAGDATGALNQIKAFFDWVKNLPGTIGAIYAFEWENIIKPILDALGVTDGITSAWAAARDLLAAILDAIGAKFEWLLSKIQPVIDGINWVREKGAGIGEKVGNFFGGDDEGGSSEEDGGWWSWRKRDAGGVVRSGVPYMVGERGPEIVVPARSGSVIPTRSLRSLASAGQAAPSNISINVHPAPGMDEGALARLVARELRKAQSGSRALHDGAAFG